MLLADAVNVSAESLTSTATWLSAAGVTAAFGIVWKMILFARKTATEDRDEAQDERGVTKRELEDVKMELREVHEELYRLRLVLVDLRAENMTLRMAIRQLGGDPNDLVE